MAAEGQSDRMASDTEMCMKQWSVTEFLRVEKKRYPLTFIIETQNHKVGKDLR